MTGVEQQLDTNALLTKLVNNTSSGLSGAVSLIGKSVRAASDTTNINKGQAQWVFNLPTEAADSKIQVLDSTGKVVHSEAGGDIKAGDHGFTWNGKDASGNQLADGGPYTLQITATDSSGNAITAANYVDGIVTGVEQANGSTLLSINGGRVDASNVVSVQQVATTTTPTAPAAT
jgi:flagellar basal-body rod modification protein FlgD